MPLRPRRRSDTVIVLSLVGLGLTLWATQGAGIYPDSLTRPWWAHPQDVLFDGPDAGHWGEQLIALRDNARAWLDPHRAPTWTLFSALALPLAGAPALAGHLVNHLLYVALGPLTYVLGRQLRLGRVGAAVAAVATVLHPEIRRNQAVFAVDLTVYAAWVGLYASAYAVRGRARPALAAGVVGALSFAAHFTTIPALFGGLAAVALTAPPGRRARTVGAYALTLFATLVVAYVIIPPISPSAFWNAIFIGITNQERDHTDAGMFVRVLAVLETARQTALPALLQWLGTQLAGRGSALASFVLLLLGILGPALERRHDHLGALAAALPRPWRLTGDRLLRGAERGLPLALVLAPLPVFFVVSASPRYANLQLPLLLLLLFRGLAAAGAILDHVAARLPRWPAGLARAALPVLAATDLVTTVHEWPRGDIPEALLAHHEAGTAIVAHFGAGTQAVAWLKETTVYTDRVSCPGIICPTGAQESDFVACLRDIQRGCDGPGDTIPYVIMTADIDYGRTPAGRAMDAWVLQKFPVVVEARAPGHLLSVAALPRQGGP